MWAVYTLAIIPNKAIKQQRGSRTARFQGEVIENSCRERTGLINNQCNYKDEAQFREPHVAEEKLTTVIKGHGTNGAEPY